MKWLVQIFLHISKVWINPKLKDIFISVVFLLELSFQTWAPGLWSNIFINLKDFNGTSYV